MVLKCFNRVTSNWTVLSSCSTTKRKVT